MTRGPTSRVAIDPQVLVAFLDTHTTRPIGGVPRRKRLTINDVVVVENDARVIRRWRSGAIKSVTKGAAVKVLTTHALTLANLSGYAVRNNLKITLRGAL